MEHKTIIFSGLLACSLIMAAGTADARSGVIKARGTNGAVTAAKGPNGGAAVAGCAAVGICRRPAGAR
jgi:hypothetical protein